MILALVDCNNFYVSCERVFQPSLQGRPVIVLSNNDGCTVSRSNEAKTLGIQMGQPYFEIRNLCRQHGVQALSSNYTLYGDMSRRVDEVLSLFTPDIENYSIDESFLDLSQLEHRGNHNLVACSHNIRNTVLRWTGIPTCIGLGETKTLAKLANFIAKKNIQFQGVCDLRRAELRSTLFPKISVAKVWGIGQQSAQKLQLQGVATVADLVAIPISQMQQILGINGVKIVQELNGIVCSDLEQDVPIQKALAVTRSFGRHVTDREEIMAAVATYAARAAAKLRRRNIVAGHITVFMRTNRYATKEKYYSNSASMWLSYPQSDTLELIKAAKACSSSIWRDGLKYHKAGVILSNIQQRGAVPRDLFAPHDKEKSAALMHAMDAINARMGDNKVHFAATGIQKNWIMRATSRTPAYTTSWDELVKAS